MVSISCWLHRIRGASRMLRLALPKSRNQESALEALGAAGVDVSTFSNRRLRQCLSIEPLSVSAPGDAGPEIREVEIVSLKDWDLPLYVEYGIADCGFVGTDVLEERGADLLTPLRLRAGRCRMSLISNTVLPPSDGAQIRVCSKYPEWTRRLLAQKPWGAEVFQLWGSVELGPLLELAELAVDIVQTGSTIKEHDLHELEVLAEIAPTLVINRAAFQRQRVALNELMARIERAGLVGA